MSDLISFDYAIKSFNQDYFGYNNAPLYRSPLPPCINFDSGSYIGKWFSDYVFIRNALKRPYVIVDINGESLTLHPKSTAVYYFGSFFALIHDWEASFCLPTKLRQKHQLLTNPATV